MLSFAQTFATRRHRSKRIRLPAMYDADIAKEKRNYHIDVTDGCDKFQPPHHILRCVASIALA